MIAFGLFKTVSDQTKSENAVRGMTGRYTELFRKGEALKQGVSPW